ncbi:hypothetical protein Tsubulata_026226 [Turnera subulata]|uniref:Mandelate racemase/muconate lactonizing enzyme C-terminal domain-containing protein n=1 Tax=Turnera subulata TaxID=218843 RepID=A0A9Q0JMC0_9ROSI|nr:hypothetical protein Tsubulata_026226 [Turnera subulata]
MKLKPHLLIGNNLSSPSPRLLKHGRARASPSPRSIAFLNRNASLCSSPLRMPNFKSVEAVRFDGPVTDFDDLEDEGVELEVETVITRILPPALTLEHGIWSIEEAVEKLKKEPPPSTHGVWRFQIAVPPSPKALIWFCCQPESSGVFPRFFMSKETENPSSKLLLLNKTRGVFGIGAAIYFASDSSCAAAKQRSIRRYLSSDSILLNTYGFLDVAFEMDSSSIKPEAGSSYFIIPEIELDEHEDISILAATLAWDSAFCTFKQAVESFEASIYQASSQFWPSTERVHYKCIKSALGNADLVETKNFHMERTDGEYSMICHQSLYKEKKGRIEDRVLGEVQSWSSFKDERGSPLSCQFCFQLAPDISVSRNMLDHASETTQCLEDCANLNAVWASLIVEECSRLGLTYFCVAPGSRSSPLAIAASTHPLTTCIACLDERSLAFHAVGYARGSQKPAVIITSSGTAVSNLYPAVVEASQDFLPLLLLTADRPPELQDAGANQSINQVNHFGSFVRFFFSLPAPTDDIPARMVLTTLDSAVYWATSAPCGPVHINCSFREPLDGTPDKWTLNCLKGLDIWMSSAEPYTKYIGMQNSLLSSSCHQVLLTEVLEKIRGAKRGLLLIGALHSEDEMWAALLLARHLNWPVAADILSGLRLRKLSSTYPEIEENIIFVDHLDHALLSDSIRGWVQFDVIVQIRSPITSKRIARMLEECFPFSYILVDDHPCRHDPSHLVTHRVQCSVPQFADSLIKAQVSQARSEWHHHLAVLDMMVGWDISFHTCAENSLTEPHVAQVISKALSSESAFFVGNSMAIRDADMYGSCSEDPVHSIADMMLSSEVSCLGIRVAGNRGASGIDGLLSTAIGFAVGCNKRVHCVIGDISFLHDTNGLAILSQRTPRKPMVILVLNNHGGAIFSLLPIADRTDARILNQFFYTSHDIAIGKLCTAHGVKHLQVRTKVELKDALLASQHEDIDSVIEVESCINANKTFHSTLEESAKRAAEHALSILSRFSVSDSIRDSFLDCKIHKMVYSLYRIELCAPPTTSSIGPDANEFIREGYVLTLSLEDGSVGYGEVAPLEIHKENLMDVEVQLRFLVHVLKGVKISVSIPLLKGSFASWMWNNLGIPEDSIFPSVRCGLEMAILSVLAARQGSSLLNLLQQQSGKRETYSRSSSVHICALIDSDGTPSEVADIAASLVQEGFNTIKLKVARRLGPVEDAAVIHEVRKRVGRKIQLRVDANRKWTYDEAIQFGFLVKDCDLQYIEEPVQGPEDILKYCEESGLPVALDETIDDFRENPLKILSKYSHPRIVAVVIKPSVVGGFEKAALIARLAQSQGKMAVVSATFESGLGLSSYVLFSYYLELQNADLFRVMNHELGQSVAHGLGTYKWLKQDVTAQPFEVHHDPSSRAVVASVADTIQRLQNFKLNNRIIHRTYSGVHVLRYQLVVKTKEFSCSFKVHEVGERNNDSVIIFLHGFLGTGEDWIPIMKGLSGSARCISVDLPGHGGSKMPSCSDMNGNSGSTLSVENVAGALHNLIEDITPGKVTLVGYSMGARIALHMVLRLNQKIDGAVIISGSPGLKDMTTRKIRKAKDDSRAHSLTVHGLQPFVETWYRGDLWKSLRSHPGFNEVVASRLRHDDVQSLANALSGLSTGRQLPLWEDLKRCDLPLLLIVGEHDTKFKAIAQKMCCEIGESEDGVDKYCTQLFEVPNAGHAVHVENPLPVISALGQFLRKLRNASITYPSEQMIARRSLYANP